MVSCSVFNNKQRQDKESKYQIRKISFRNNKYPEELSNVIYFGVILMKKKLYENSQSRQLGSQVIIRLCRCINWRKHSKNVFLVFRWPVLIIDLVRYTQLKILSNYSYTSFLRIPEFLLFNSYTIIQILSFVRSLSYKNVKNRLR